MRRIGEKRFSDEDQRLFARLSSDRNPMHMDPVAARRLVTGRQVVHGVHVLMTGLELWAADGRTPPLAVSCSFGNPVSVGENVVFEKEDGERECVVNASVDGLVCAQITISTMSIESRLPHGPADASAMRAQVLGSLDSPVDEAPETHVGRSYALRIEDADFSAHFPGLQRCVGGRALAALAGLSFFVGMVCPGLHSIFSSLTIGLREDASCGDRLSFLVRKYDPRFRVFEISFDGRFRGSIRAFLRMLPQGQPSLADLPAYVRSGEFSPSRSLILGGSRGLGQLTARLLSAGGGDVILTYATGADDARATSDEINKAGRGTSRTLKADVMLDRFESLAVPWQTLNAVYYFATPRIFRKKAAVFEPALFREFVSFYVDRFYELCAHLEASAGAGGVRVFFPSSVAVAERPKGMTEYSMAKSAAETLVEDVNRNFKRVKVVCARLPRLNTDQTATILKVPSASNLETLLPIIRSMQGEGPREPSSA